MTLILYIKNLNVKYKVNSRTLVSIMGIITNVNPLICAGFPFDKRKKYLYNNVYMDTNFLNLHIYATSIGSKS